MYRHLLLPLDDSLLAADTARKGVQFARALGAQVTFFHAREDYAATSIGALSALFAPAALDEPIDGRARAILAKAEVVAREAGVAYASVAVTSNRPYEAILETAEARGCDLIFIASHGRRGISGLMLGSQTQKVLQHASIPVLVSAVESNLPAGEMIRSLAIIQDEHRSLAAVIHGLEFALRQAREHNTVPSLPLLHAMLHYIEAFPQTLHHPKEDAYLFRKLRMRTSECDALLDELDVQHADGERWMYQLTHALAVYEADPAGGLDAFAAAVEGFAAMQMQHMRLETKVVLPAACRHLTADDWAEIDHAFAGNCDPRLAFDDDEEFRALFARILHLAPAHAAAGRQGNGAVHDVSG